jgi:succinoglycan biosynthesis protein ExoA
MDVVVPAYNEEAEIGACLDHIAAQRYPRAAIHVWVVDAGSTDATAEVVAARPDANLVLIPAAGRLNAAEAMNAGTRRGTAPLVARVDAHTRLDADYLRNAAAALAAAPADVACVGGQPEQVGATRFGRAVSLARRSSFGVGGSVYADARRLAYVDTVQAGVYRRAALHAVGGFTETMLVGEDEEINWRLRRAGHRILLDTSLRFRYTTRPSWPGVFRQYRNYGRSRARVLAAHPSSLRPRHLAPSGLAATLAALALAGARRRAARSALAIAAGAYGSAAAAAALRAARWDERALAPSVVAAFTALHSGYAIGLLEGGGELAAAAVLGREPSRAVARR